MAQVPEFNIYQPASRPEAASKSYRGTSFSVRDYKAMKPVEQHTLDNYCEYMRKHEKSLPK